jgi:NAD-dependent SIR2 family protein deacetylase
LRKTNGIKKADVDYCCYTTPLEETCPHTPSILQKAKKIFNLKIMKIHGSVNWLQCPNCNRLFTGVGDEKDVWEQYFKPKHCPDCNSFMMLEPDDASKSPLLEQFFITPTFVKIFENAHIKMTWYNAYMDLSEATEVVFIGYSLPEADYHFRTLLRRAIRRDASITVVLTNSDKPKDYIPKYLHSTFPVIRYKSFFGHDRLSFDLSGTKAYFQRVMGEQTIRGRLQSLRNRFRRHDIP